MVTEVVETQVETPAQADPEPQPSVTEAPATEPVVESAAPEAEAAAVPQVEVTAEKPDYLTREEWEREKKEVADRAAAEALELDRRRRQTENARKAQQEVRDREEQQEAADVIRAALVAQGFSPEVATDEAVTRTVDRLARKKADRNAAGALETMDQAWDYLTSGATKQMTDAEINAAFSALDDQAQEAAKRISPKLQHLVNQIRPQIEAEARKGYIAESELPRLKETWAAEQAAKGREGQTELQRVEGTPAASGDPTLAQYNVMSAQERSALPAEVKDRMARRAMGLG